MTLTFSQYETKVMGFRLPQADASYAVLGLIGELGELYGSWAKNIRDGTPMDEENSKKELGDILWFLAAICQDLDVSLAEVAQMNIDKLSKRSAKGTLRGSGDNR
jgi:NTP pyrophosphatase (non-canonical NTP hydrolase)